MITQNTNHNLRPKKARKLGDLAILYGIINTPFWGLLFFKPKAALWLICGQFLRANAVILSYGLTAITRFRNSPMTTGLVMTAYFLSIVMAYNSIYVWKVFSVFVALAVPFFPILTDADDLYRLAFIDIHSQGLLIYAGVFTLASLIHNGTIYIGKGSKNVSKRGESWLYLLFDKLLSRYIPVSEFFICCFIEPALAIGAGIYLWSSGIDPTFGSFLILMGANEVVLQLIDKSHQVQVQSLLNV
ncbi:hypothetical protein QQ020_23415 [Fulvivirgaceae bacterium BMA12]|uniref:Uncharacterized protein n=1 Tax=Agaribacillus aureus TaxID=3051825 RepID=A0ABT8LBA6_9BACT|nr:hypothetical protein [Fulvivirgaceae bacterium BMA12]